MKSVIFDLDGTLADTSADLIAAANHCFEERGLGRPLDPIDDALTAFRGGRAMLKLGIERLDLDEDVADEDYQLLLDYYADNIDVETELYPGVISALEDLQADGWLLGVCTNKPESLALSLLERLGVLHMFGAVLGADSLPVRKPDPTHLTATVEALGGDMALTMLVGDTITDAKTARAAGVPLILVAFGPEGVGIDRLEPDVLLSHYDDMPRIAAELIGA
ncbi:phosphoglycolate phosphatase [Rubricella aquisinus]|uniref:phosphoglycolate phosphatase n=1 Tax=Rubricella aquisinus TaxID=2028108 RepID=A0A840WQC1_9RHOB|nr:HAD-IA family hydrolase [Rubricella aquisinus]MBB5515872.1 phosphoglycolate phosphatase [Rubricella aquisinus]